MTPRSSVRFAELLPALGLGPEAEAHRELLIHGISTPELAGAGALVFVAQDSAFSALAQSKAALAIVSESYAVRAKELQVSFPLLFTRDAMLSFARASAFFQSEAQPAPGIHPSAMIHPSARIGEGARIAAFVSVGAGAEIGAGACLHARVEVGPRSRVGAGSVLFPGVVLYQDVRLGERVRIHANSVIGADGFGYVQEKTPAGVRHAKIHHLGGVEIGDEVEIGASSTVDRGTLGDTVIGRGCIIDNQVQIGHNCRLEEGVIICGCTGLAGSVHVGKFAVLAGFVGVANKMRIGAGARVAAYTAIQGHVPPGVTWGGIPGMPHRSWLRTQMLFEKLPELLGQRKRRMEAR